MNQKIQCLIDGGFITIADVMEYAEQHNLNEMDKYYEERLDQLHQDMMDEERRLQLERDFYENEEPQYDGAGYTIDDRYESEPIWTEGPQRSVEPLYIIASTSCRPTMHETYIFESDADGNITNYGEYGGLAARFGDDDWGNKDLAVERAMGEGLYELVRHISTEGMVTHSLYKRIQEQ